MGTGEIQIAYAPLVQATCDNVCMNTTEAAWVAGIIEGEGSIVWRLKSGSPAANIQVTMSDYDVLERLHQWTGMGTLCSRKKGAHGRKDLWVWNVTAQADFLSLAAQIEPYLLSRRGSRLREVRARLVEHQEDVAARAAQRRDFCPKGHAKTNGTCRACNSESQRASRARKKAGI